MPFDTAVGPEEPFVRLCRAESVEWLRIRSTGIGASEIAAVFGENPWMSALELYALKTERLEPVELGEAAEMGKRLEDAVAAMLRDKTGLPFERCGELLGSRQHSWALCTPDYWTTNEGELWLAQLKTTGGFNAEDWENEPPRHVYLQCQHEMLVTGAMRNYVGVLLGGRHFSFRWAQIDRDEDAIRDIIEKGAAFWKLILRNEAPMPDGSDSATRTLNRLYPAENSTGIALSAESENWDTELQQVRADILKLEDRENELRNLFRAAIGDAQSGILPGGTHKYIWKTQERKEHVVRASSSRVLRKVKI